MEKSTWDGEEEGERRVDAREEVEGMPQASTLSTDHVSKEKGRGAGRGAGQGRTYMYWMHLY